MKYDIAMQLYANDIIDKEYYAMVNKVFSGVRIPQSALAPGIDYKNDTTYNFSGVLGKSSYLSELEITNKKDYLDMKYDVFGLKFEISQNKDKKNALHIRREVFAGPFGGKTLAYYMVDKDMDSNQTILRYYDGEACSLVKETADEDFYEVKDFQKLGLLPDEEVVLEDADVIELASNLIAPFTIGEGNFEEKITEIMEKAKQKVKN